MSVMDIFPYKHDRFTKNMSYFPLLMKVMTHFDLRTFDISSHFEISKTEILNVSNVMCGVYACGYIYV